MSHPRHLRVEADGGRAIVRLMDHRVMGSEVVEQLAAELLAVLNRPGIRRVVLDLADVRLLSSAALDRIVVLHHRADAAGVELQLTRLRPEVREVLEMTGLSRRGGVGKR
jgi:anti-anti-sigma factor